MLEILSLILFIVILSVLVFIHELGHFWTAKKMGVKVDEFGMGIPPRAWGKKVGETIYSINWLPLGGFVKIRGEDMTDYDPKDPGNFMNKKPWQRSAILVAGVFMNFVLAVTLFYILLGTNGWKSAPLMMLSDYDFKFGTREKIPNVITFMQNDSPAMKAGLKPGDTVVELVYQDQFTMPKSAEEIRNFMKDKQDKEITVKTKSLINSEENSYQVTPVYFENVKQAAIGISMADAMYLDYSKGNNPIFAGFSHSYNVMGYSFSILGDLVSMSVKEKTLEPVSAGVSGPVGIFGAVKSVLEMGGPRVAYTILDLMALLSLSLAVMNLLPIPALDGGRLLFVGIEVVTRRKPSQKLENWAHQIGFMVLIGLLIIITLKDVWQMF